MRAIKRTVAAIAVIVTAGALLFATPQPKAEALVGSDFYPGYIITDARFYDSASMSAPEIQRFLDSKVASCPGQNGQTCLRYARFDTFDRAPSSRCGAYSGAFGEYAATVIAKVAQACGINPQVLLVMLQKEQGLITATSPTERQYRVAMGYGCPDTAPCDAQYYGFYNQVYKAAWQLRQYGVNPNSWRYRIGNVAVQYHPNAACGSSVVSIVNQATASLYNYTPYQPNPAALANLGGVGDGCSSYGNRNFWVHFSNWFGPPTQPNGRPYIVAEYAAQGGAGGPLGAAISDIVVIPENDGGLGQAFVNGSIYWTWTGGAHTVPAGAIRDYYFARNGAAGSMGWPISRQDVIGDGRAQAFSFGSVYSSPAGTFIVASALRAGYFLQNGALGPLGFPTAESNCAGSICSQRFVGGTVYGGPAGAFPVEKIVDAGYRAAGGPTGAWGAPASTLQAIPNGGWGQAFVAGSVYSRDRAQFFLVSGAIRDFYFTKNGAVGELGYPISQAACNAGVCVQRFERGALIQGPGNAVRVGYPEIDAANAAAGGLGSALTSVVYIADNGGGSGQAFERGSIYLQSGASVAFAVAGAQRDAYFAVGGASGPLGWPTSASSCAAQVCQQQFSGGVVVTSPAGAFSSTGRIGSAYRSAGAAGGSWGQPLTNVVRIPNGGGGDGQAFANGSTYAKGTGAAHFVSGAIRDYYFARGGAAGALGWPTGDQSCSGSICSQAFDGGVILSVAGTAGVLTPAFSAAYAQAGGAWGAPLTEPTAIASYGGGIGQAFVNASAYARTGGPVYAVAGRIRDAYFARGGATGVLGWPMSNPACAGGTCTQSFQFGNLIDDGTSVAVG